MSRLGVSAMMGGEAQGNVEAEAEKTRRIEALEEEVKNLTLQLREQNAGDESKQRGKMNGHRGGVANGSTPGYTATRRGREAGRPRGSGSGSSSMANKREGARKRDEGPAPAQVGRVKWVSSDDTPRTVSNLIVGAAMPSAVVGFPVSLHAKYEANCYKALKAVANATKKCSEEQGTFIACAPSFRENRNELTVTVVRLGDEPKSIDDADVLTVARNTDYRVLAGAIAKRAREDQPSILRAIGPAAAFSAVRALATSREYLEQDGGSTDVVAVPRFGKVHVDGRDGDTTTIELCVYTTNPFDRAAPPPVPTDDVVPAD